MFQQALSHLKLFKLTTAAKSQCSAQNFQDIKTKMTRGAQSTWALANYTTYCTECTKTFACKIYLVKDAEISSIFKVFSQ